MSKLDLLESLKIRHKELDKEILLGYKTYMSNTQLEQLKKEKLYVKDRITRLELDKRQIL